MKKLTCIFLTGFILTGCSNRYGSFYNQRQHENFGHFMQLNNDSTYEWSSWVEWHDVNSFGRWSNIPGKRNHILLESSSSDYTHIPIHIRESSQEHSGTTIIFTQGKQFYDCEFNEVFVNGNPITIDKDTIFLSIGNVDSLRVRLGFSDWMRKNLTATLLYPAIYSQVYYPSNSASNVYEITLPIYPHAKNSSTYYPRASTLFSYDSLETEAYFRNGKWYVFSKNGKWIPYKRYRER